MKYFQLLPELLKGSERQLLVVSSISPVGRVSISIEPEAPWEPETLDDRIHDAEKFIDDCSNAYLGKKLIGSTEI